MNSDQQTTFNSPLRYPGGKRKLVNFIKLVFAQNNMLGGEYAEPFAGGASVALALLLDGTASRVHINDIDQGVYCFWDIVLNQTEALTQLIERTPVTMEEWHRQRAILISHQGDITTNATRLALGFATFFLNRTNHSGIVRAGVIGGKNQAGQWKLDVRFNKRNLIFRIERIAKRAEQVSLTNLDAAVFLKSVAPKLAGKGLIYLDPPYYEKGPELYHNSYVHQDHEQIAGLVSALEGPWIVSYDNAQEIAVMYAAHEALSTSYSLSYTAQDRYRGRELMFFSKGLTRPDVENPSSVSTAEYLRNMQLHLFKSAVG